MNLAGEPQTFDPRKGGDVSSSNLHFLLFEGLTKVSKDGSLILSEAEDVSISEKETIYTFRLKDCFWSDGSKVTAYDYENSWKKILSPDFPSPNSNLLYPIKNAKNAKKGKISLSEVGIYAKDAKTLVITLENPTPYFLQITSFSTLFPVKDPKIFNGPFILEKHKLNDFILLKKNPFYRETEKIFLKNVVLMHIPDQNTALEMFLHGELDLLNYRLPQLFPSENFMLEMPKNATSTCVFNTNNSLFKNKNIRKAFSLSIDRESIIKCIVQKNAKAANGLFPSHAIDFKMFDPKKAKELFILGLKEIGLTSNDLKEITLRYSSSPTNDLVVQILQEQWKSVLNVIVLLEKSDRPSFFEDLYNHNFEIAYTSLVPQYLDPTSILNRFSSTNISKNYSSWESASYSELLEKANFCQGEDRIKILLQAEKIILEEAPITPIFHSKSEILAKDYVKGIEITPLGTLDISHIHIE